MRSSPAVALVLVAVLASCHGGGPASVPRAEAQGGLQGPLRTSVEQSFAQGRWDDALGVCRAVHDVRRDDCGARYCEFLARSMQALDRMNDFLVPHSGLGVVKLVFEFPGLDHAMTDAHDAAEDVIAGRCEWDLPKLPVLLGSSEDPLMRGEARGRWTTRDAHLIAAIFSSMQYVMHTAIASRNMDPGWQATEMPPLLADMQRHVVAQDALLFSQPADPTVLRGGWLDRNGNHQPDAPDELLIDIFEPGTDRRLFDFSKAEFVRGEALPKAPLTPTASLPSARCGYQRYHIDDLASGDEVSLTDGMSFSPDGTKVAVPLVVDGHSQIVVMDLHGKNRRCVTCGQPGNNDGVRWRPGSSDTILFISDRDHKFAIGNEGGGLGQELYAMRLDGTHVTRLTKSHAWATNYHANWSMDGKRLVWGSTESRTWDVMVADFADDARGLRLENARSIVHDTTWWETHGFSADGRRVITTNTRAGMLATDIYAVDVETGEKQRLTTPDAWDEHAHLSPDGRKISWISGRFRPAAVHALSDGSISPLYDFLWIGPGILFDFFPPAGNSTELTLMDADGTHVQPLTSDHLVVADNEWSFDSKRIVFRQTDGWKLTNPTRLRLLTFDDCQ
jgi:Tol biopolymer transport system component